MKWTWTPAAIALAIPFAAAAEPAQASKSTVIRQKPFADGRVVTSVKAGQGLDIVKREGAWYFVKVKAVEGWAPMLSVRRTKPAAAATAGSLSATATGRSSGGGIVSTTGVRGLNEENLAAAVFSETAVAAAEKSRVSPAEAAVFAAAQGVVPHAVPALAAPAPAETTVGGGK